MTFADLDVVIVGNVGVDTNVYLHGAEVDFSVESNFTENIDCVGQAGGYVSRGFAQLGYRTGFIGYLGDDHNGRYVREVFTKDGIDLTATFIDPTGTGRSLNIMYRDGRRKNFYDGKGHMTLKPDLDICRSVLSRTKLAHFSIPNWARQLLPVARELGLVISCDIQDIEAFDDLYRRDFIDHADILFFSSVNHPDPEPLIGECIRRNPEQVLVVGMGAAGCVLGTREGIEIFPVVELDTLVVDTNGAGDGLAVGFLSSYVLGGYSSHDSILRGQIAARYTCSIKGSSSQLITRLELERIFDAHC